MNWREKIIMNNIGSTLWNGLEKMLDFFCFRVFHLKFLKNKWEQIIQFVKFGIVGVSNTVVSYAIYIVSLLIMQKVTMAPKYDYLIAQFISFALSVLWSFYWNRKYVFKESREEISWGKSLIKTYISYAFTGIFLNSILAILWVQYLGISKIIAPIFNLLISVPLNFIMNKFWAFKK